MNHPVYFIYNYLFENNCLLATNYPFTEQITTSHNLIKKNYL